MDNFRFDLQLFANVEIDLAGAGGDGKNLYATIDGTTGWVTVAEYQAAVDGGHSATIIASLCKENEKHDGDNEDYMSTDKTLSIVVPDPSTEYEMSIRIIVDGEDISALKGYQFLLVKDVNVSDLAHPSWEAATNCSVECVGSNGTTELISVETRSDSNHWSASFSMLFDSRTAGRVGIPCWANINGVFVNRGNTYATESVSFFDIAASTGELTLLSGAVSIPKNQVVRMLGFPNSAVIGYDYNNYFLNVEDSTLMAETTIDGSLQYSVSTGVVAILVAPGEKPSIASGDIKFTFSASPSGKPIYVDAGGISGLEPGMSFDMENMNTQKKCVCTVSEDGNWMLLSGDKVSIYKLGALPLDGMRFNTYNCTIGDSQEPMPLTLKLAEASATVGTTYYTLDKKGKVSLCVDGEGNPLNAAPAISGDVIGYFKVVTDWNDEQPEVTVTFAGKALTEGAIESEVSGYTGKVAVDATAVAEITHGGNIRDLSRLTVTGISYDSWGPCDGNITVLNLPSTASTDSNVKTARTYDWNGVGLFEMNDNWNNGTSFANIGSIADVHDSGTIISSYMEVTSTKNPTSGIAIITKMRVVTKNWETGEVKGFNDAYMNTYGKFDPNLNLTQVSIDSTGTKGINLPSILTKDTKVKVNITLPTDGSGAGSVFSGLKASDTVTGTDTDGQITVNSKKFILHSGDNPPCVILGNGTVETGTFTINSANPTLTASAVPQYSKDTVTRDITYTGSGDGVKVVVKMNGARTGGEIDGVMGLDEGEKVVIKNYVGNTSTLNSTTTIEKKNGVITKVFSGDGLPKPITLTSTTADENTNLLNWRTFEMKSAFDFGKTTVGSMGIFEEDANGNLTIAAQPSTGVVLGPFGEQKKYVRALASKASGTYTINYLEVNVFNDAYNPYSEYELDQLTHCYNFDETAVVSIVAPTDGNLALNRGGIDLKDRKEVETVPETKYDELGYEYIEYHDIEHVIKEKVPIFTVTNAQAGKTYTGFTAKDTVTGTLAKGQKLTVNGAAFTSGADGVVIISGDGKAMFGSFFVGTAGIQSAHFVWDDVSFAVADVITKTIKGYKDAVVQFHDGEVIGITGLTAGKTVTIETKNENGVVTKTETYTAKAVAGSTALDIEYKVDGVTMSTYTVPDVGTNIAGVEAFTYTEDANVDTGRMAYQVTTNGDTVVVNVRDGEVIGISGLTSGDDGIPKGVVTITDTNGNEIVYNASGLNVMSMQAGTTFKTAALKQGQLAWIGNGNYEVGAGAITAEVITSGDEVGQGEVRFVDGTLKLWEGENEHTNLAKSITTRKTEIDGTITETQVEYDANGIPTEKYRNVTVTVKDGKVTGIIGLGAKQGGPGEKVKVTTTVTNPDDPYNSTVRMETYHATYDNATGKIRVTCTDDIGNAKSFVFADVNQNILDPSTTWAIANQVTEQDFDWNNTGYFRALPNENNPKLYNICWTEIGNGEWATDLMAQSWGRIDGSNAGEVYLKVTSTKDENGIAIISDMRLVQVQTNGTFVDYPATKGKLDYLAIELKDKTANGVNLPKHTANVCIWTNQEGDGCKFTGLNATDYVEIPYDDDPDHVDYNNFGLNGTITVNGKQFTVKNDNKRGAVIYGDGTLGRGDFLITGTATAAATPWAGVDLANNLTYTSASDTGDGVWVSVHSDGDGGIGEVSGLDAGETVIITSTKGNKEDIRAVEDENGVLVTRRITHNGLNVCFTQRGDADTIRQTAVTRESGFTAENLFDYGATEDGKVGFFRADMTDPDNPVPTVAQQQESDKVTFEKGNLCLAVGATKDAKTCTITHLEILGMSERGSFENMPFFEVDKAKYPTVDFPDMPIPPIRNIEFVAPEGVDLTLKADAINLAPITVGGEEDGKTVPVTIAKGPRVVAIHVTGAQAGKRYMGLSAIDAVSAALLTKGQTLIVNGVTFTAAANDAFTIRGDGKAVIDGTFAIGRNGITSAGDGFTQTITGAANGVVRFQDGEVVGLSGLTNGQKVTVQRKNASNVVLRTETYTAKAVAGAFEITYTLTGTGLPNQTIKYTVPDSQTNITGVTVHEYTADTDVVRNVDSYTVAMNGDEKIVVVEQNGKVIAISGMTSDEDGTQNGSVTVTDENGNVAKYTASGVEFTTLKNGTTVTTAALKQNKDVWLGGEHYKAGADGAITYQMTESGVRFVDGTLRLWDGGKVPDCEKSLTARTTDVDGNIIETRVDFSANEMPGADTRNIVVTVKDGKVTGIKSFGAHKDGAGETVTITTTVNPDDPYNRTVHTTTYQAAMVNGKIHVTRTDDLENAAWFDFEDVNQNILNTSTQWKVTNQVTVQDFDWNGTGYFFAAADATKTNVYNLNWTFDHGDNTKDFARPLDTQDVDSGYWGNISKDDKDKVYLEVKAATDEKGIATVSSMRLVKVQKDGTFAAAPTTAKIGNLEIEAAGLSGINLPAHTANVRIWAKQPGVFTGVNSKDVVEVSGPWTDDEGNYYPGNPFSGMITVNGKSFEVTDEKGVRIMGNGELDYGVFIIKDKATAAISEPEGDFDMNKTIAYTYDPSKAEGNGVKIVVFPEIGIDSVFGLDAGETVTLTSTIKGNGDVITAVADEAHPGDVIVTRAETHDGMVVRYTMAGSAAEISARDVYLKTGYTVANLFDYGATEDGKLGFFLADENGVVNVAAQTAGQTVTFEEAGKKYIALAATKNKTTGAVTITKMVGVGFTGEEFSDMPLSAIGAVNIDAPAGVDFTLSNQAGRTTPVHVTGAQAGKKYAGFSAIDTVSANELTKGKTLIVNGVTFKAAANDAFTIRGDGKAVIDGSFAIGKSLVIAGDGCTRTVTGAAKAVVQVVNGRVYGLTGLLNGQKVTIQTKFDDGGVQTETYAVKAVPGSTALDVTYTLTKTDKPVKTVAYTVPDSATNIAGVAVWEFTEDTANPIVTEKDTFTVATNGDTITVIEQNGVVKEIFGLENGGSVTVTEKNGNVAAYTAAGVDLTINEPLKNIKTVPLVAGQTVSIDGDSTYTVGADGAPVFYADTAASLQLVEGALQFTADGESVTTKAGDITSEVRYNASNVVGEAVGVVIAVSDGVVTSLKGLDRATDGEDGESVTVTTGENWVSYAAAYCTETGKEGWVKVTRTDSAGNESTCVFADNTLDVLDPGVKWTVTNLVTEQNFDGVGVGYFLVNADGTMEPAKPQREEPFDRIDKSDAGKVYLKVTSESMKVNDHDEVGIITGFGFVKVLENGTFAETVAPQNFQGITLDVDQAVGFALPPHTEKVAIINAKDENGFAGLNAADTVSGVETGTVSIGKVDKKGKFTATATFTVAEAGKFTVTGAGTIVEGVFTVTGKAVGSAGPKPENETATKEITYIGPKNGDGVKVTFVANSPYGEGEIDSVQDLDEGEKVVINHYEYTAKGAKQYMTTTITKQDGIVTKTMKNSTWPTAVVMTASNADASMDVFGQRGYQMASTFNFTNPKTTAAVGLFEIGDPVIINGDQTEAPAAFGDVDKDYIMVGATKKNGTYTTSYFEVLHYDHAKNQLGTVSGDGLLDGGVTIAAPMNGNLALSAALSGMPRTYSFNVTGAQAGKSYNGFGEKDTITGTLAKGKTVTVGGKAFTAGVGGNGIFSETITNEYGEEETIADGDVIIRGDGKAIEGVFTLGSGFETAGVDRNGTVFTKKITGTAKNAVVTIVDGDITRITGIAAGQNLTVTYTNLSMGGRVSTITYKAEAIRGTTDLKVTCTQTHEGITTTKTAVLAKDADIWDDRYSFDPALISAPKITSFTNNFDWTAKNGVGYFAVATDGDGNISATVTEEKTTIKPSAGQRYLKVDMAADGKIGMLSLQEISGYGTLQYVGWVEYDEWGNPTDTLNIENISISAPSAFALTLDREKLYLPMGIHLAIDDVVKGSVISNLQEGDVVSTTKLAKSDSVTINGETYTAGAADLLRLNITAGGAELVDGTLMFTGNATIETTNKSRETTGQFTVTGGAAVKVLNGEVVSVSGLTNGSVTVTDGQGNNFATYTKAGVSYSPHADGLLTTAALEAGKTVTIGGETYMTGAKGTMTFNVSGGTATVVDGVLKFMGDSTAALENDGIVIFDEAAPDDDDIYADVRVKVRSGKVVSITGLKKGDEIKVGTTTYKAVSDTIIKRYETEAGIDTALTAHLAKAGRNVIGASYLDLTAATDITGNAPEGQFAWKDSSGRTIPSTGYFAVNARTKAAAITAQSAKVAVTAPKNTAKADNSVVYVMVNTEIGDGMGKQILHIDGLKATTDVNGRTTVSGNSPALLNGATLTVTAPTTALIYTKQDTDTFHIMLNNVADASEISGLGAGDKVKTAVLAAPKDLGGAVEYESVNIDGVSYGAGVKGALEFQGEGTASEGPKRTTLLNGTIALIDGLYETAILSGSAGDKDNDITVTAENLDSDSVLVTAKNGVVTSITGLETVGATVTVAQTGGATVVYKVIYSEEVSAGKYNIMVERTEGDKITYASFTNLNNIYATSSKDRNGNYVLPKGYNYASTKSFSTNTKVLFTESEVVNRKVQPRTVYVAANYNEENNAYYGNFALADSAPLTAHGEYYLAATVTTVKGVTTISKVEVVQINALGVPTVVKNARVGRVIIDGTIDVEQGAFAKVSFSIPKNVAVTAENVALGSVFTGVEKGDIISTRNTGTFTFGVDGNTVTVYVKKNGFTETRVYKSSTKEIKTVMDGSTVTKIEDFTKGSLSIVETKADRGRIQTDYAYDAKGVLTKTFIAENGVRKVFRQVTVGGKVDERTGFMFESQPTIDQVVSDFDWTMDKNKIGYSVVSNGKATVKTAKTTINKGDTKKYIEVTLSKDGTIESIQQTVFNADAAASNGMKKTDEKFTGTITITAPTKALTFDRNKVDFDTIDDTAKVAVTGAVAGSKITHLALGDTVTTAKLAVANAKTGDPAQSVIVDVGDGTNGKFTAGAAGVLSFLVQKVNGADALTVTGGTIALDATSGVRLGGKYAYIGTKLVTVMKGDLMVTVTGSGKTYTIGSLKEGERFTVEDFATGTVREYKRSATTLFCTTTKDGVTTTSVYSIGAGVSITSAILEGTKGWTTYTDANKTFNDDNTLVSGKAVTVDLAALDKRIAADGKDAGGLSGSYQFVIDKYMADPKKFAGAASIIRVDNRLDVQQVIGSVANTYTYKADLDMVYEVSGYEGWNGYPTGQHIAQTIKAADKWEVYGSDQADSIVGAAKGEDTLIGGAGNDTLTGGGANDTFEFTFNGTNGQDTLKGYASGKDKITIEGEFNVSAGVGSNLFRAALLNNGSVRLWKDNDGNGSFDDGEDSVELVGMGNGKAVTINGNNYYFGNGKAVKAETFAYAEGGFYRAKKGLANVLQVGTDSTKATKTTLGGTVSIDLNSVTDKGIGYYKNIAVVDASKSGNDVILTADGDGSTLKGGTYKSTLKAGAGQDSLVGGSGEDVFWFDTVEKNDVVTGYASGKDSLYLGDFDKEKDTAVNVNGLKVTVSGNDVVFSNGDLGSVTLKNGVNTAKPVTIRTDKEGTATADYYVGKAGTYDKNGKLTKASNTFTATVGKDAEIEAGAVALTSYYAGNDTANDTLKLVGTDKTNKLTANVSLQEMAKHASSIDTLDVSGLTTAKDSEITLQGKKEGTFTLIGSKSSTVKETFDLKNLTAGDNKVIITNFSVDDVIELAAGMSLTKTSADNAANTVYSLKLGEADYGTLTITGVKAANINDNGGKLTDTRKPQP